LSLGHPPLPLGVPPPLGPPPGGPLPRRSLLKGEPKVPQEFKMVQKLYGASPSQPSSDLVQTLDSHEPEYTHLFGAPPPPPPPGLTLGVAAGLQLGAGLATVPPPPGRAFPPPPPRTVSYQAGSIPQPLGGAPPKPPQAPVLGMYACMHSKCTIKYCKYLQCNNIFVILLSP